MAQPFQPASAQVGRQLAECHLEDVALDGLRSLGYSVAFGLDLAPGEAKAERESYAQPLLPGRLEAALRRLNPKSRLARRATAYWDRLLGHVAKRSA